MSTINNNKQQQQQHHVYVLYGSQTGNSEQAAEDFCRQLQDKFNTNNKNDEFWQQQHSLQPHQNVMVTTTCMQLDDFLEVKQAKFDGHCMIIFVSSYGVGQAPLGAYRFRSLAEELLRQPKKDASSNNNNNNHNIIYQGLHYAVCGLGDSTYPTYLKNPTTIDEALSKAGATRLQAMGKADAHQMGGDQSQDKVIQQWIDNLWVPLAKALTTAQEEESTTIIMDAAKMQQDTLQILQRLDPDFVVKEEKMTSNHANNAGGSKITLYIVVGISVALLAILVGNWNNYKLSFMNF
jgi:sulfite reductase alpha subunit-like flavoprotein